MKSPKIDIGLDSQYNPYYLGLTDNSEYDVNWNITNSICEVTAPGYNKISVNFIPKSINQYKSSQLGITCDEDEDCIPLPDGIYTVKYSIYPNATYFIEKSFMRTNLIRCQYGEAYLKVDFSSNRHKKAEDKRMLESIAMLIEGSVAETNNCDFEQATKYYNKAKQMLDNFHKCCN